MELIYTCTKKAILKDYLLELGLSKKFCKKVKMEGKMYINGVISKNYFEVKENDLIKIVYNEKDNLDILECFENLKILYKDEYFIVVYKPINIAIQPSRKHYQRNLISIIKSYFKNSSIDGNIHIVNRLDYQTSGLVIATNSGYIHSLFSKIQITKKYLAVLDGKINTQEGIIDLPIEKEENGIKRKISETGKKSITSYKLITQNDFESVVEVNLITGRTHQIRVHFKHLGYPLVGDKLYGKPSERLYLNCYNLSFNHPVKNDLIEITEIDEDFKNKINKLKSL